MPRPLTLVALALTGLFTTSATAETITVCAVGCHHTSINAAIDASSNGDVIQLAAEIYAEGATLKTDGKAIRILGTADKSGIATSILDGSDSHRVLECTDSEGIDTIFENLVVRNGSAATGAGLYASYSSPTLINCTFTSNLADYGGGMASQYGSPTLTDCVFTGNSTDYGAGMAILSGFPILNTCTFTSNSATKWGGGMYNEIEGNPTLNDCTFTENSAELGGGMYNFFISSPTLSHCTFTSNSATSHGGGMYNEESSSPTLTNCTFTENSADDGGGGMYNFDSSPILNNCTFASNSAKFGGGLFNNDSSTPILTGCNFCGNTSVIGNRNIDGDPIDDKNSGNLLLLNCNPGDVNFDLAVDSEDLGYLLGRWAASSVLNADINQDGEVNGADLAYILGYFGGPTDGTPAP